MKLLDKNPSVKEKAKKVVNELNRGIQNFGIINHPHYGRIYAYEVDGVGSHYCADDANVPSVLSLPYLEFCSRTDPIYLNTRKFVLSTDNPYFFSGNVAEGIGSPHGEGPDFIWPMSIIMRALTSTEDEEIMECLAMLKRSTAGTGFMHESFHKNDAVKFTRKWFAWANTLFGELIMTIAEEKPHLLFNME